MLLCNHLNIYVFHHLTLDWIGIHFQSKVAAQTFSFFAARVAPVDWGGTMEWFLSELAQLKSLSSKRFLTENQQNSTTTVNILECLKNAN